MAQEQNFHTDWFTVIALAIICALAWGVSAIMTSARVRKQFQTRPWLKWATPIVITLVLVFGFYAVYYSIEYAGPLHYAARANDIETVKEELENGVSDDDFDEALYECAELDHVEVLKILLKDPKAKENLNYNFILDIKISSTYIKLEFIEVMEYSER